MIKKARHLIIPAVAALLLLGGCTGKSPNTGNKSGRKALPTDTLYTRQAAMSIYGYQPVRALHIIDSAVIVGNLDEVQADICRARIYSQTRMFSQVDSLLNGPEGTSLDKAQEIGELLLQNDSVKQNIKLRYDVVEILSIAHKMNNDTLGWMKWTRELVDVCHLMGEQGETAALRTEAELGAALYYIGLETEGIAKLDSAIYALGARPSFRFNELDAMIIALKRKIVILSSNDKFVETLPLARRINELLDDYEKHPDAYHDNSFREPENATKRADYIAFYRNQAQNFITAAYTSLGEHSSMMESYGKLEKIVRDATAREHVARYSALQQKLEAERLHTQAKKADFVALVVIIFSLLLIVFAVVVIIKNRSIVRKNRQLAQQIADAVSYKNKYIEVKLAQKPSIPDVETMSEEQLFQYINEVVVHEKLFLDPRFGRQTIMERFSLSKGRVGTIFSKGSEFSKLSSYILRLRMEYAAKLLVEQPEMTIVQIANECGFSSHTYFSSCFRQHYGIIPKDFRHDVLEKEPIDDLPAVENEPGIETNNE